MFAQQAAPTAPGPKPPDLLKSSEFYVLLGVLAGILLIGAVVLHFIDRWRKRQTDGPLSGRETTLDLTTYREMYENGEITKSEYDKILARIAAQMKREVGLDTAGSAPAPPAQPPGPPPADGPPPPPGGG